MKKNGSSVDSSYSKMAVTFRKRFTREHMKVIISHESKQRITAVDV